MNKIKTQFLSRELSLKLRELGFEEDTLAYYVGKDPEIFLCDEKYIKIANFKLTSKISFRAPLWQQAFDFFRTQKDLHCVIYDVFDENDKLVWDFDIIDNNSEEEEYDIPLSETYEEARLKCLTKLIEIAK